MRRILSRTCFGLVLICVDSCRTRADSCYTRVDSCWLVLDSYWFVLTSVDSCWFVQTPVDLCWYSCIRIDLILLYKVVQRTVSFDNFCHAKKNFRLSKGTRVQKNFARARDVDKYTGKRVFKVNKGGKCKTDA